MDRFYCKVYFRGFKDYLKVGFPVTKKNIIKTVVPNRKLNFETVEAENWENIENVLIDDNSFARNQADSVKKYFTIHLKNLQIPEDFKYEKGSLRIVVEYETNEV